MNDNRTAAIHELDATHRVGKNGVEAVSDELATQLDSADLVKVKFLRSALGGTTTEAAAERLADLAGATLIETRGHTAVFEA
jgi:RNA-binding protein